MEYVLFGMTVHRKEFVSCNLEVVGLFVLKQTCIGTYLYLYVFHVII